MTLSRELWAELSVGSRAIRRREAAAPSADQPFETPCPQPMWEAVMEAIREPAFQ
jgi:hypothetical protein